MKSQVEELRNQSFSRTLDCETCIDYIKQIRKLEITMAEQSRTQTALRDKIERTQEAVRERDACITEMEEERDRFAESMSYSAREQDLICQIEKLRIQTEMQQTVIRQLRGEQQQPSGDPQRTQFGIRPANPFL